MSWAEIKHALNSTLGQTDFKPLDKLVGAAPRHAVFTENGSFVAPASLVWVTAIAAGADGVAGTRGGSIGGKGGNCGQYVVRYPLALVEGQSYPVTVGNGNTVIGSLSLAKGGGATNIPWIGSEANTHGLINCGGAGTYQSNGKGGGLGLDGSEGGAGAVTGQNDYYGGSGGAGSPAPFAFLKPNSKGGDGGGVSFAGSAGLGYGSGGGGGCSTITTGQATAAGLGGPGIVIIEW